MQKPKAQIQRQKIFLFREMIFSYTGHISVHQSFLETPYIAIQNSVDLTMLTTKKKTSVDWANFIWDLFKQLVNDLYQHVEFEEDIEIDESLFRRRCKYHHGNPHVGLKVWIFGIIERASNRLLLFPIEGRDADTILPIIVVHVKQSSGIFSDN